MQNVNMNQVVGDCHILFVCIDSLRYDVALEEQQSHGTPTLNAFGPWRKCYAPGNFTYPSHQAMFSGFFPVDADISNMKDREKLFFSEDIGMGRKAPEHAYTFQVSNAGHQVDFAIRKLSKIPENQLIMMYLNFSALHYPNYFYIPGAKKDSREAHAAALRYVDRELGKLFQPFQKKGNTFVICCSDHGTCYGEDGVWYHGINHPIVNTVPYKHFFL